MERPFGAGTGALMRTAVPWLLLDVGGEVLYLSSVDSLWFLRSFVVVAAEQLQAEQAAEDSGSRVPSSADSASAVPDSEASEAVAASVVAAPPWRPDRACGTAALLLQRCCTPRRQRRSGRAAASVGRCRWVATVATDREDGAVGRSRSPTTVSAQRSACTSSASSTATCGLAWRLEVRPVASAVDVQACCSASEVVLGAVVC